MNICVFCSSSNNLDDIYLNAAASLGRAIARRGHTLVFGGYDMGLMGAVARAAVEAGGRVRGITTEGLSAKGRAVVAGIEEERTADLSARKERMVELSDAFVTLPGGLGTFDEFFSVISRVKAGELSAPSALLDVDGFFKPLATLLDDACARGLNSSDWRASCEIFDDAEALVSWIEGAR
ncbi:MAG: TIGR00730 family Rossman fold protein [Slackia sp.]